MMMPESLWGNEKDQALQDWPLLTADEQNLFIPHAISESTWQKLSAITLT